MGGETDFNSPAYTRMKSTVIILVVAAAIAAFATFFTLTFTMADPPATAQDRNVPGHTTGTGRNSLLSP